MNFWLATTNNNKIKEIKNILHIYHEEKKKRLFVIESLNSLKNYKSPEETGSSFQANAKIKAEALLEHLKSTALFKKPLAILAEDSGLGLESLNGDPGVRSARYSGEKASDESNNKLLLKNLENQKNRKARYSSALYFLFLGIEKEERADFLAHCEGEITHQERGKGGFGYDPLFVPKGEDKTFAELPFDFKQKLSHRRKALNQWLKYMEKQGFFL